MAIMKGTLLHVFGGSFFGNLLTAFCFGVLTAQTSSYYHTFPNDATPLKLVVGFLWALDAFQLACVTQSLYWWFVKNYYNPVSLSSATWEFTVYQISTVCASVTVQTFFAHRVYSRRASHISAWRTITLMIPPGFHSERQSLSRSPRASPCVDSVWIWCRNMILKFQLMVEEYTWLVVTWLATQAVADVVIAASMCILLRRRRTGFPKTDSVINHMTLYTISTGLVTSVLSGILLVMFAKDGFHFSVLTIGVPLGGIYSVTMLANLHTRKILLTRLATPTPLEVVNFSLRKRIRLKIADSATSDFQSTMVNVTREIVRDDMDVKPMLSSWSSLSSIVINSGMYENLIATIHIWGREQHREEGKLGTWQNPA
ncbi:hypothetical protein BS47DRAFT_1383140 [Hydnum rufescens UP504]|uniref:DUF6534 domain-containing protein n=1 Tax=Hydnum rufescens UP504 TaxID=1448309 RepID=A0A9P6AUC4_9AGAM|nr:hypothetical protein BS47DRAFT_1383140 [Hydnum rufescens UP504]